MVDCAEGSGWILARAGGVNAIIGIFSEPWRDPTLWKVSDVPSVREVSHFSHRRNPSGSLRQLRVTAWLKAPGGRAAPLRSCGHKNPTHQARQRAHPRKNDRHECNASADVPQAGGDTFEPEKRHGAAAGAA